MAFASSFDGIIVCRLAVGAGEALFGQAIALYFSYWYAKDEIAVRISIFIGAGALSGAIGGLVAFGISSIPNPPFAAWRLLFAFEALPSLALAFVVLYALPTRPESSRFLDEHERAILLRKLARESLSEGHTGVQVRHRCLCLGDNEVRRAHSGTACDVHSPFRSPMSSLAFTAA